MTKLQWDQVGERIYETGVDHGVLYKSDGSGVPWSGLTSIQEDFGGDTTTPHYLDGIKFNDSQTTGNFIATMKALTYPDEFLEYEGVSEIDTGIYVDGQPHKTFGLSYRSLIGNDTVGLDLGYKIHILYSLLAVPEIPTYLTFGDKVSPAEFSWRLVGIPQDSVNYRSTAHAIVDSRYLNPALLQVLENILYGNESQDSTLPELSNLVEFVANWAA